MRRKPRELADLRTESGEQRVVCEWLDTCGVLYCHVPNENSHRLHSQGIRGVKAGVPDLLVFESTSDPSVRGVAIEMKRRGEKPTDKQHEWLSKLGAQGWATAWFDDSMEAISWLKTLGIGR